MGKQSFTFKECSLMLVVLNRIILIKVAVIGSDEFPMFSN